jgi:CRP-like cAMP-binding protein
VSWAVGSARSPARTSPRASPRRSSRYEGEELCLHGITQQDLADLVGASRSFVSTLINEMKRDGLIEARGRVLVLKNEPGLTARSNVAAQR